MAKTQAASHRGVVAEVLTDAAGDLGPGGRVQSTDGHGCLEGHCITRWT